jgi:hypothetical protein
VELTRGRDGAAESLVQYSYDAINNVRCKAMRMNKAAFSPPYPDACTLGPEGADGPDRISRYVIDVRGHL